MNRKPALIASGAIVAGMLALSIWAWVQLPAGARMPVHWGIQGTPDRYGDKVEGLLVLPLIAVAVVALFALIPLIEPRRRNLERSHLAYTAVWIATVLVLAAIDVTVVLAALGQAVDIPSVMAITIGLLFVVMGRVMDRIRSNFIFGIRTPWTLSSELAWAETHRLGGRLFILLGTLLILSALVGNALLVFGLMLGGSIVLLAVLVAYSYHIWKTDPNKQSIGRG
ncbi:MAG: SdpI family protein [Chloroflexi bacterium]|nr:SdpI family protein [Chloroflexota bacterium]